MTTSENVDKSFDYNGGSDSGCYNNSGGANSGGGYDSNDNDGGGDGYKVVTLATMLVEVATRRRDGGGEGGGCNSSCNGFGWWKSKREVNYPILLSCNPNSSRNILYWQDRIGNRIKKSYHIAIPNNWLE